MSMLTIRQAAAAIGAEARGADVAFERVSTDTRNIMPGDLFVALRGERYDGHSFAQQALDAGAAAVMVAAAAGCRVLPAIVADDTRLGLGELAAHWRRRMPARLVAVTGSNGKTTVKEMLAAILRAAAGDSAVLATQGNLNNDIGVPLTLLRLRENHAYGVIEMGMNHAGEISYLTRLARPDVALVNNAGTAHIGMLGSVEAIAHAKGEIFEGLGTDGIAVLNADDSHAPLWRELAGSRRILDFGMDQPAAVRGSYRATALGSEIGADTPIGRLEFTLHMAGAHNVMNALAATAAALALGVEAGAIAQGLAACRGIAGRLQHKPALHGAALIDDSYNANPDSVRAALAVLAAAPGRKILVLGDMGELGENAAAMHAGIGRAARDFGVDRLLALGEMSREAVAAFGAGGMHFERIEELLAQLENELAADVTVLVKGSRFMQMERVVKSFEVTI